MYLEDSAAGVCPAIRDGCEFISVEFQSVQRSKGCRQAARRRQRQIRPDDVTAQKVVQSHNVHEVGSASVQWQQK